MKLAIVSRSIGYRTPQGKGGGFLHATQKASPRRYIDGYAGIGRYDFGLGPVRDGTALDARG